MDRPGKTGLAGKRIEFVGLQATITDVLVRVQALDGTHTTTLVRPSQPWVEIAPSQGIAGVAAAYLVHGFEHIMFGTDHLLFVLGLMLMVHDLWTLLKTITAFTVAHSITLAAATLGYVHVPGPRWRPQLRFQSCSSGPRFCALGVARRASRCASPGSSRSSSGSCMGSDSPAGLPAWAAATGHPRRPVVFQCRRRGRPTVVRGAPATGFALLRSAQHPLAAARAHGAGLCRRLCGRLLDDRPDSRHGHGNRMTSSGAIPYVSSDTRPRHNAASCAVPHPRR